MERRWQLIATVRRAFAIGALALACLLFALPTQAYARLNDVTSAYSATQDVPVSGSVLTAADIPEGEYSTTITSSSYMCKFTNVTLTSVGGELWASFNLSTAYDAIYQGTAEEAAQLTNADGTDYSNYNAPGPFGVRAERRFNLPIPAVNEPITLATYNGGSSGTEGGVWYTRTIVVNSSSAIEKAMNSATEPPAQEETRQPEAASNGNDANETATSTNNTTASSEQTGEQTKKKTKKKSSSDDEKSNTKSDTDDKAPAQTAPAAGGGQVPGASGAPGGSGSGASASKDSAKKQDGSGSAASAQAEAAAGPNAKRGQAISVVGTDIPLAEIPDQMTRADSQQPSEGQVPLPVVVAIVVAVNLALAGAFVLGLRKVWRGKLPRD